MKLRFTRPAAEDITAILDYLRLRSPQGAKRVRDRVRAIEKLLIELPFAGAQTRLDWLRRITTKPYPYVIFYEVTADEIIIHAIRHTAMNPESMPDSRDA